MPNNTKWVSLKDYIIQCDERNSNNMFSLDSVRGISVNKELIATKANMDGVSLSPYKLFKHNEFCFVTVTSRNSNKITISINPDRDTYIVSSSYEVFKVRDENILLPEYLYLIFNRPEFDRYARFHSWGSARETFSFSEMERVEIPLPSIDEQKRIVETWKRLRMVKEQNEAMATPLMQLCQSRLQELKRKYTPTEIGPYIEQYDKRNLDNKFNLNDVRGISTDKKFLPTKANLDGVSLTSYKVVNKFDFAYVADTSRRGDKIAVALNTAEEKVLISSIYTTFRSKDYISLLPEYLFLMLSRSEFDRYARFHSWGSARETFNWDDMCRVAIPIPPIEEQQAIVSIYKCAAECKRIAEEVDKLSREICPALIQKVIHS